MFTASSQLLFKQAKGQYQRGVSLIELMVGITIGMLVVVVALSTVLMTKTASSTISDSTQLEQQANMVMALIGEQVRQAGAMNVTQSGPMMVLFDDANFSGFSASGGGGRKIAVNGREGTTTVGEILMVTYQNPASGQGGSDENCSGVSGRYPNGQPRKSGVVSIIARYQTYLTCEGLGGVGVQPIASNVQEFEVRYLRNNGINAESLRASQIGSTWTGVDGVEICLHLVGDATNAVAGVNANVKSCTGAAIPDDKRLHRVVRNVFYLSNSAAL